MEEFVVILCAVLLFMGGCATGEVVRGTTVLTDCTKMERTILIGQVVECKLKEERK